jgi:CheY-like chemotaxis protein
MTQPRPSILCVDDDRDVVEVVQAILEDEGYAVSCLYDLTDDALGRYQESGELVMIGQFIDREAALELALPS